MYEMDVNKQQPSNMDGDDPQAPASSEELSELFCQPCGVGDKRREAHGYCCDCGEYLCDDCFQYHTKLTICRHHVLLDRNAMPIDQPCDTTRDRCVQRCPVHQQEVVKYFCPAHAYLGCSACMVLDHRKCDDVEYITAVSKEFAESAEYKTFSHRIETMMQSAYHLIHVTRERVARSARFYAKAMQNVNRLRKEITAALDQLEIDVKEQTEKLAKEDNGRLSAVSGKCENVLKELTNIVNEFQRLRDSQLSCQLYIYLKNSVNNVTTLENVLTAIENKTVIKYDFQPSDEMKNILKTPERLGKLFKWDFTEAGANHVTDIHVKTKSDKHTCCITGSVMMSDDKLIVADRINDKIKYIDVRLGSVVSEIELSSSPWDIALLTDGRIAVTLPKEKRILLLKCDNGALTSEGEISVPRECWGIAFNSGKIVVTHEDPGSVDVIDMTGSVIKRFSTNELGQELFKRPSYAAVTDDLDTIYVADWDSNSVTSLDSEGAVKRVYRDGDLEYPGKLVVDQTGVVTVCGINSSNVHLISSDCTKIQIISNTTDLDHPRTVSYSEDNETLYVGMWENDNIRVYRLS